MTSVPNIYRESQWLMVFTFRTTTRITWFLPGPKTITIQDFLKSSEFTRYPAGPFKKRLFGSMAVYTNLAYPVMQGFLRRDGGQIYSRMFLFFLCFVNPWGHPYRFSCLLTAQANQRLTDSQKSRRRWLAPSSYR